MINHYILQIFVLVFVFFIGFTNPTFSQTENAENNELILTDEELIIIFSGFIIAVISIFLYLARHILFQKKSVYEKGDYESKKNRDYEKYHSDWTSDEFIGEKKSKKSENFRELYQNSNLPNYYKILGVKQNATPLEIKRKYRQLVKEWHPDKNPDPQTKQRMAEINEAYEVLSDNEQKKKYDKYFDVS